MPINSCFINGFTINSLACRRKNIVPPGPIQQHHKGHPYQISNYYGKIWERPEEEINFGNLEKSHIKISILLKGHLLEQIIENNISSIVPLIYISNLEINTKEPVISISNLNIWNN